MIPANVGDAGPLPKTTSSRTCRRPAGGGHQSRWQGPGAAAAQVLPSAGRPTLRPPGRLGRSPGGVTVQWAASAPLKSTRTLIPAMSLQ